MFNSPDFNTECPCSSSFSTISHTLLPYAEEEEKVVMGATHFCQSWQRSSKESSAKEELRKEVSSMDKDKAKDSKDRSMEKDKAR